MTLPQGAFLFAMALLAGALNSVAGGGSFFTFPTLLLTGVPSIQANATNTVALWPGILASIGAYRKELASYRGVLLPLVSISLLGGFLGALLLLNTPQKIFEQMIPFLMLLATLLFAFGGQITTRLRRRFTTTVTSSRLLLIGVGLLQFIIAIYGGYFGAGIGILMLAGLALTGMENLHEMNAVKTVLAGCINGIAAVIFIIKGAVFWPEALLMAVGAMIGGYGGASLARRIDPRYIRIFVIVVGSALTIYFFITYLLLPILYPPAHA